MTIPSNGRTLDLTSDLGMDYATLTAIRNLADNATNDLADARKRLSLIAIMAQTAMNRLDGGAPLFSLRSRRMVERSAQ